MTRYFTLDMPAARFLRNTLVFSCASLFPLLVLYILLTPGFTASLAEGGPALARFLRQVVTNGLPVVFAVNYVSFSLLALAERRPPRAVNSLLLIVVDLLARLSIFILLHALIYVISAGWFGSFGGERMTALRVVAPTLARSALFENISGVYLYATLISALPLYVSAIRQHAANDATAATLPGRAIRSLPQGLGPGLLALALFGAFVLALTGIAGTIASLQAG